MRSIGWTTRAATATIGSMSEPDAVPLPREGEVFFDVRGESRTMRLSWYADSAVAVFSIWQGNRCTGTFRLPFADLPRMAGMLQSGPPSRQAKMAAAAPGAAFADAGGAHGYPQDAGYPMAATGAYEGYDAGPAGYGHGAPGAAQGAGPGGFASHGYAAAGYETAAYGAADYGDVPAYHQAGGPDGDYGHGYGGASYSGGYQTGRHDRPGQEQDGYPAHYREQAARQDSTGYLPAPGYAGPGGQPGHHGQAAPAARPAYQDPAASAERPGYLDHGGHGGLPGYLGEPGYQREDAYRGEAGYRERGFSPDYPDAHPGMPGGRYDDGAPFDTAGTAYQAGPGAHRGSGPDWAAAPGMPGAAHAQQGGEWLAPPAAPPAWHGDGTGPVADDGTGGFPSDQPATAHQAADWEAATAAYRAL